MVVLRKRVHEDRVFGKVRDDHKYNYMGIFVDNPKSFYTMINKLLEKNGIERHAYDKEVKDPHVTFRHESENKPFLDDLFGKEIPITITHYGYDDSLGTEGVKIKFNSIPNIPELKEMIRTNGDRIGGMDKYHITLSLKVGAQAKDTKSIKEWTELKNKETIKMVIDGFVR